MSGSFSSHPSGMTAYSGAKKKGRGQLELLPTLFIPTTFPNLFSTHFSVDNKSRRILVPVLRLDGLRVDDLGLVDPGLRLEVLGIVDLLRRVDGGLEVLEEGSGLGRDVVNEDLEGVVGAGRTGEVGGGGGSKVSL